LSPTATGSQADGGNLKAISRNRLKRSVEHANFGFRSASTTTSSVLSSVFSNQFVEHVMSASSVPSSSRTSHAIFLSPTSSTFTPTSNHFPPTYLTSVSDEQFDETEMVMADVVNNKDTNNNINADKDDDAAANNEPPATTTKTNQKFITNNLDEFDLPTETTIDNSNEQNIIENNRSTDDDDDNKKENDAFDDNDKDSTESIVVDHNNGSNNENIVEHDKESDTQNDDPSTFLAYEHQHENVAIVSLDNGENSEELKKKIKYESDEEKIKFFPLHHDDGNDSEKIKLPGNDGKTNEKRENHFVINAIPMHTPGVPHMFVHDGNSEESAESRFNQTSEEEQPRILVNISIATDSGQGSQTHAVYMLHVMVPASKDFFPPQPPVPTDTTTPAAAPTCDCDEAVIQNYTKTIEILADNTDGHEKSIKEIDEKNDISCPILILEGEGVSFNI
jgi:hypothetical protein